MRSHACSMGFISWDLDGQQRVRISSYSFSSRTAALLCAVEHCHPSGCSSACHRILCWQTERSVPPATLHTSCHYVHTLCCKITSSVCHSMQCQPTLERRPNESLDSARIRSRLLPGSLRARTRPLPRNRQKRDSSVKGLFSTAVVASVLFVSSTAPFQPRVQGRVAANSASSSNEEPSPESSS